MKLKESRLIIKAEEGYGIKGVQIYIENEPYLIVGNIVEYIHGDLLKSFLDEKNIIYETFKDSSGKEYPKAKGENNSYFSVGMFNGVLVKNKIKIEEKIKSTYYGIGVDKNHLKEMEEKGFLGKYSIEFK